MIVNKRVKIIKKKVNERERERETSTELFFKKLFLVIEMMT